jgi:hypothetical protein
VKSSLGKQENHLPKLFFSQGRLSWSDKLRR